jgi:hypothetical protein
MHGSGKGGYFWPYFGLHESQLTCGSHESPITNFYFPLLAREDVGVKISAGEDDADAQVFALDLAVQGGGGGNCAGGFDRAAQVLGDQVHRVNNFLLGY